MLMNKNRPFFFFEFEIRDSNFVFEIFKKFIVNIFRVVVFLPLCEKIRIRINFFLRKKQTQKVSKNKDADDNNNNNNISRCRAFRKEREAKSKVN